MKNKRAYYDCPIIAAYMEKQFGFNFVGENGDPIFFKKTGNVIEWMLAHVRQEKDMC